MRIQSEPSRAATMAALGFLSGVTAVAALGLARAPEPTIARVRPFITPIVAAAAPDIVDTCQAISPGGQR